MSLLNLDVWNISESYCISWICIGARSVRTFVERLRPTVTPHWRHRRRKNQGTTNYLHQQMINCTDASY